MDGPGWAYHAIPIKTYQDRRRQSPEHAFQHGPSPPSKHSDITTKSWTNSGSKEEMLDIYSSRDPVILDLLTYVPNDEVMECTINVHKPLPSWIESKFVQMGDACHPMLPYVAQGAAQAIEDGGVLTQVLTETTDIKLALAVYELMRKERAERIQNSTVCTKNNPHLLDGEAQRKRDEKIRAANEGGENPDEWADPRWQECMYGADVMRKMRERWKELVELVEGCHVDAVKRMISHGI